MCPNVTEIAVYHRFINYRVGVTWVRVAALTALVPGRFVVRHRGGLCCSDQFAIAAAHVHGLAADPALVEVEPLLQLMELVDDVAVVLLGVVPPADLYNISRHAKAARNASPYVWRRRSRPTNTRAMKAERSATTIALIAATPATISLTSASVSAIAPHHTSHEKRRSYEPSVTRAAPAVVFDSSAEMLAMDRMRWLVIGL